MGGHVRTEVVGSSRVLVVNDDGHTHTHTLDPSVSTLKMNKYNVILATIYDLHADLYLIKFHNT